MFSFVKPLATTHIHLARELESEQQHAQAEHHFVSGEDWKSAVNMYRGLDMWDDAYASKRYLSYVVNNSNLAREKKYSLKNGIIDSLQNKYSNIIKINTDMFEKIEITSTDMLVTERGLPYPFIVPSFPIITSDDKLDYGSKMN